MNSTPEATKEKLFEEFNTVVAEAEQLLKTVATAGSDKAGEMKASFEARLADAGAQLARIRADAAGRARHAARVTDDYVVANPWKAVGGAAAVGALAGLVAGLLLARR